jgi:hypothetical protein
MIKYLVCDFNRLDTSKLDKSCDCNYGEVMNGGENCRSESGWS